jgi:hypothetical protein
MKTIVGYEKTTKGRIIGIEKQFTNAPSVQHSYIDGDLWIKGIGVLFTDKKEAEKQREKTFERAYTFSFFDKLFYANVPKYDYKNIVKQTLGK